MKQDSLYPDRTSYIYRCREIYTGDEAPFDGYIRISEGKILDIGRKEPEAVEGAVFMDLAEYKVIPGLVDLHVHGYMGYDVASADTDAVLSMASRLASEGTTSFLPTLGAMPLDRTEEVIRSVKAIALDKSGEGADILGLHLEGPFLNPQKKGAMRLDYLLEPSLDLMIKWFELSEGTLNHVTIAPELPSAREVIAFLSRQGVTVAAGHSMATYEETLEAISWGVSVGNHTYNAMRSFHHRDPGIVGAVLSNRRIWAEVLCDGIHVHPGAILALLAAKGTGRTYLVSDAIAPAGLSPGLYNSLGSDIIIDEIGRAFLSDGTLAGSTTTLLRCVKNVMRWTGEPLERVIPMATVNPSLVANVFDRKGTLSPGKDADLVVLDDNDEVVLSVVRGNVVCGSYNSNVECRDHR